MGMHRSDSGCGLFYFRSIGRNQAVWTEKAGSETEVNYDHV